MNPDFETNTPFEKKLAALKPRIERDFRAVILRASSKPEPIWSRPKFYEKMKPFLLTGALGFLLGGVVMYAFIQRFYEVRPIPQFESHARISSSFPPVQWDEQTLRSLKSPGDFVKLHTRKLPVPTMDWDSPSTNLSLLRKMQSGEERF